MMRPRINFVTLGVAGMARARSFYERLGLVPSKASNAEVTFFDVNGTVLSLFGHDALAGDAGMAPAPAPAFAAWRWRGTRRARRKPTPFWRMRKIRRPDRQEGTEGFLRLFRLFRRPGRAFVEVAYNPSFH
jgi:catechol 2,3-dioxygenase-like lactoylglutathione lyase family enzyme